MRFAAIMLMMGLGAMVGPLRAQPASEQDILCLRAMAKVSAIAERETKDPAIGTARKTLLDEFTSAIATSNSWFVGRFTTLPADQRTKAAIDAQDSKLAELGEDELFQLTVNCIDLVQESRARILGKAR